MQHQIYGIVSTAGAAVGWRAEAGSVVAPVMVEVDADASFTVDAADPSRVIGVTVPPGLAETTFDGVLGGVAWHRDLLAARNGDRLAIDLRCTHEWARVATVAAVRKWYPAVLDESLLAVDAALAYAAVGSPARANWLFALGSRRLCDLADTVLTGPVPDAAKGIVLEALGAAARQFPDDDAAEEVRDYAARLENAGLLPADFNVRLTELLLPASRVALVAGGDPDASAEPLTALDPRLVPARVLAWRPALEPAFDVTVTDDAVRVQVALAAGVSSQDARAMRLIAYAAVADGGQPWKAELLRPDDSGRMLASTLRLAGSRPDRLVVGVYAAEHAAEVRADLAGRELATAHRALLESWMHYRALRLRRVLVPAPRAEFRGDDERLEGQAEAALRRGVDALAEAHSIDPDAVPAAGLAAAEAWQAAREAGPDTDPATAPLLAELAVVLPDFLDT